VLDQLSSDIRHSLRVLRTAPAFTAIAVLSLALGIGANTAIFSIVNAVMLKTLPVADPDRLVQIGLAWNGRYTRRSFTNPIWETLRDRHADLFEGAFAFASNAFDENAGGERRSLDGMWVSGGLFETLGVHPWVGRLLTRADDVRGGGGPDGPVVVISYAFWRDRYGASPTAIGSRLTLGGQSFTIVGVTPPGFLGPNVGSAFKVAVPLGCEPLLSGKDSMLDVTDGWWLSMMARLKPQTTMMQTEAALRAIQQSVRDAAVPPNAGPKERARFLEEPFTLLSAAAGTSSLRERYRVALFALLGIVGLVLLIACANLANLFVARASGRQKEFAVRLAIGASRGRIVRQLLVESLLLAVAGALLGLAFADAASRLIVRSLSSAQAPVFVDVAIDWRVLAFTVVAAMATVVLFGMAPALRSARVSANDVLKSGGRGIAHGWARLDVEKALVVLQIALSLVLVFGAALFVRSFVALATLHPGFDASHVMQVATDLARADVPQSQRLLVFDRIAAELRTIPGVESVGWVQFPPVRGSDSTNRIEVPGFTATGRDRYILSNRVSAGYFETMGTPFIAGRDFDAHDTIGAQPVVIVNEAMMRKYFHGEHPIGREIEVQVERNEWRSLTVVGLVRDTVYHNLRETPPPTMYAAVSQDARPSHSLTLVVRTRADRPIVVEREVTAAGARIDPNITFEFRSMETQLADSLIQERLLAMLSAFFGLLALLVAGIGLYGMMSLAVTRRRGELGVRMALGADPRGIVWLVLRDVAIVTAFGLVAGAAIALASGRVVATLLFGLTPTDPRTCVAAALLLGGVALLAGYLPARRAARLDPMIALRDE
jgi:putative ABC transport system permease protein